ncbi:hypothetical protein [Burkholderia sp. BCC1977]|uniref:hypothetical protein n=1 Tax=Burkholderia sp. BCC1977 TaxID=2817440 RepID=UPI002ABE864B|nr:hypothetical protein [Burkholderia sp. BCC1977]
MKTGHSGTAYLAASEQDYRRFGVPESGIELYEDGARTDGSPGGFEWWYFDAHLDDGATLVVVFMTKPLTEVGGGLAPTIRIDLLMPDGTAVNRIGHWQPSEYYASSEHCDVRIGDNVFHGDLHRYNIRAKVDDVEVEIQLNGQLLPWRPETGYMLFQREARERYLGWFVAVPQGKVMARYSVGGNERQVGGIGYHDHNWGDRALPRLIHNWYWARGQAGPYSVIAAMVTSHADFMHAPIPTFMLAKDGVVIADDATKVNFSASNVHIDDLTGKPVAGVTRYEWSDDLTRYVITFTHRKDLVRSPMVDRLPCLKRCIAKLIGFDGAYHRFLGELRIEHFEGDRLVEVQTNDAVWELMYLGRNMPVRAEVPSQYTRDRAAFGR